MEVSVICEINKVVYVLKSLRQRPNLKVALLTVYSHKPRVLPCFIMQCFKEIATNTLSHRTQVIIFQKRLKIVIAVLNHT